MANRDGRASRQWPMWQVTRIIEYRMTLRAPDRESAKEWASEGDEQQAVSHQVKGETAKKLPA